MAVHQRLPSNLTELERICKEEWQRIPKSRCEKLSGYYRNLGSLKAGTRHHGEFLHYGNSFPPTFPEDLLAHVSPNDWPIVAKHANTSLRGSINAAPATITSESDTERCLAERAEIT